MSNLVFLTRFWNNFHQIHSYQKTGILNNVNSLRANKPLGPKQDSQSQQIKPMPED